MTRKHVVDIKLQKQLLLISWLFLPFSNSCMDITPLQNAILSGNYEKTKLLIYQGAPINECNPQGYAPIHFAATQHNPDMIFLLAKNGADINMPVFEESNTIHTPMTIAIRHCNPLILKALLACGTHTNWSNIQGETALHLAISTGCIWMVKMLVEAGIRLSSTKVYGVSPETLAFSKICDNNKLYLSIYDYLLHTAKPTQTLITAVQNQKTEEIIRLLQEQGDPNARMPDGNSLLHFFIEPYHKEPSQADEIAKTLISYNANVNDQNLEGDTPLHRAVEMQNTRLALLLVSRGANAGIQNKKGELAMTKNLHFWLNLWHPENKHWLLNWIPFLQTIKGFL